MERIQLNTCSGKEMLLLWFVFGEEIVICLYSCKNRDFFFFFFFTKDK